MKTCQSCKNENRDSAVFCDACGAELSASQNLGFRAAQEETSGLAIASFVSGCLFFLLPAAITAIVLGHISRSQIAKSRGRLRGAGMSRTGILLGYAGVAMVAAIAIVAGIAHPKLVREQMASNEESAIRMLRTMTYVTGTYSKTYKSGFPPALSALGPPPDGIAESASGANLIGPQLAAGLRKGYTLRYTPTSSHRDGNYDGFTATAEPVTPGTTGTRYFFVDETGVIRAEANGPANAASPPLK